MLPIRVGGMPGGARTRRAPHSGIAAFKYAVAVVLMKYGFSFLNGDPSVRQRA